MAQPDSPRSDDAIRAELEQILGSSSFANAGRHSRFLRYIVERTLAGEGDQLKEYVLGVEVFDRTDAYDPRLDSIVRVEARRLRSRLEEYYSGPGVGAEVLISVPRGSYVPTFVHRIDTQVEPPTAVSPALANETSSETSARASKSARWSAPAIAAGTVVAVAAAVALWTYFQTPSPTLASPRPSIAVLPFLPYSSSDSDGMLAARITDAVTTELARIGTLAVASRTSAARYTAELRPARQIATELAVELLIEGSAIVTGERIAVSARLVDGRLDRKVWVGEYETTTAEIGPLSRRLAGEAAAAISKHRPRPEG